MRHAWTGTELRYLVSRYPHKSTAVIAAFLNVSVSAVYNQAHLLGLQKSDEYLKSKCSGRFTKLSKAGIQHRFKKGHIPANKGKMMSAEVREKVSRTFSIPKWCD